MRTPRRLSALLAGGTAALLVGCSGGGGDIQAVSSPTPEPPAPAALVRSAAMQTDGMQSSRYVLTTSTEQGDTEVVFKGQGIYDWSTDTGQTTYDVPVGTVQQRLVGPDLYLALPQQPDAFFKLKVADVASTPLGGTVDPSAQLHMLAAVADAELMGEQEVRGVETTHYRGSYDVARALRGARGLQQAALRSSLGVAADVSEATYDVFLDDAGRLRKLTQTVEVAATAERGGSPATVTTTLELYDFGITVKVMPPPGAQVRDGSPLLTALRQVLSTPQPAAAAPSAVPKAPVPSVLPSPPAVPG